MLREAHSRAFQRRVSSLSDSLSCAETWPANVLASQAGRSGSARRIGAKVKSARHVWGPGFSDASSTAGESVIPGVCARPHRGCRVPLLPPPAAAVDQPHRTPCFAAALCSSPFACSAYGSRDYRPMIRKRRVQDGRPAACCASSPPLLTSQQVSAPSRQPSLSPKTFAQPAELPNRLLLLKLAGTPTLRLPLRFAGVCLVPLAPSCAQHRYPLMGAPASAGCKRGRCLLAAAGSALGRRAAAGHSTSTAACGVCRAGDGCRRCTHRRGSRRAAPARRRRPVCSDQRQCRSHCGAHVMQCAVREPQLMMGGCQQRGAAARLMPARLQRAAMLQ